MSMTYERWLWALEAAARYYETLERTFDQGDMKPETHEALTRTLMDICDDCQTFDMGQLARICREERARIEEYAAAALERGSSGISFRVMLSPSMLGRRAFDEAEGAARPDPGTTFWFEAGPEGNRALVSAPDEDGWREIPDQQGRARAPAGGEDRVREGQGLADGGGGELPQDQEPADPCGLGERGDQ